MGVSDYNEDPDLNTNISGINTAEGWAAANINNAFRQMMADIKVMNNGLADESLLLAKADNLASVASADTSLTNLGGTTDGKALFTALDHATQRALLSLVVGTDVQAFSANLTAFLAALSMPTADGTVGQVLATDGAGNADWAAPSIGVGQTWQDMSGSRTHSTSYQNTTGRPIEVRLRAGENYEVSSNGSTWVQVGQGTGGNYENQGSIVPDGHYYRVNGSTTIVFWAELR